MNSQFYSGVMEIPRMASLLALIRSKLKRLVLEMLPLQTHLFSYASSHESFILPAPSLSA